MNKLIANLCSRCGNERIVSRIWKEQIGLSVVTTTEKVCADAACEKIVAAERLKQQERRAAREMRRS